VINYIETSDWGAKVRELTDARVDHRQKFR